MTARRLLSTGLAIAAVVATVLGMVYVAVSCQSLPAFLGAVPGDPHPRTRLGAALLVAAVAFAFGAVATRRRRAGR